MLHAARSMSTGRARATSRSEASAAPLRASSARPSRTTARAVRRTTATIAAAAMIHGAREAQPRRWAGVGVARGAVRGRSAAPRGTSGVGTLGARPGVGARRRELVLPGEHALARLPGRPDRRRGVVLARQRDAADGQHRAGGHGELPGGLPALLRVLRQPAEDDLVETRRQRRADPRRRDGLLVQVRVHQRDRVAAHERPPAGEQLVQHAGQRVDVGAGVRRRRPNRSGAMYSVLPTAVPVAVSAGPAVSSAPRAMPKSAR